jgi:hypothetical protein
VVLATPLAGFERNVVLAKKQMAWRIKTHPPRHRDCDRDRDDRLLDHAAARAREEQ